jgi:serine/threonine protein kinase, bacterial
MLEKARERRPQSTERVIEALRAIRGPAAEQPAVAAPSTISAGVGEVKPAPQARAGREATPAALVAGVALAAGIGGWFLFHRPKPPHPQPPVDVVIEKPLTPKPSEPVPETPVVPLGMVAIPSGRLAMGRAYYGKPNALDVPPHEVNVEPFAIARTEVTNREFAEFNGHKRGKPDLPVTDVSHEEAARYCSFRYQKGRLPAEAEWEWAARGSEGRLYPWGNEFDKSCVNGMRGAGGAVERGGAHACGATPTGIEDLSGNVWEWTSSPASIYPGSALSAPPGEYYVVRGGSFFNTNVDELTATGRQFIAAPNRFTGFRCAVDLR